MTRPRTIVHLLTLGIFAWLASLAMAETREFSADIVRTNADGRPAGQSGKLYVSGDKVRIETPDFADGFFVVDGAADAAYFVRPAKEVFMEARQSSPLTQILVPVDPADPCRKWQAMAISAGAVRNGGQWRCKRIGEETVDGRKTIAYSVSSPRHEQILSWIDPDLKILLRSQTEGGAEIDVKNIQEGPQSANLFEIPAGYRKFDPQRLIEIVKKSDVWVEPIH